MHRIAFLPGDGIGPEVAQAATRVLTRACEINQVAIEFTECEFGGAAIDAFGDPFPEKTKELCEKSDAIFLGAVGGPKWEQGGPRPEVGLLAIRKTFGLFANLRPVTIYDSQIDQSPLKNDRAANVDMMFVRELTGGIYFGDRQEGDDAAWDRCDYSKAEVERVARVAFEAARKRKGRVTSVDKANVLATSRLWRKVVTDLHASEFNDVSLDHMLIDAMAMKLIQSPASYDVILTENMFGDILSDEASVIGASIGLAPSASLSEGTMGLYEPIHGSGPDIAGQDIANPTGAILSAAMMARYSLNESATADVIEAAVNAVLSAGHGTIDLGGEDSCSAFSQRVVDAI